MGDIPDISLVQNCQILVLLVKLRLLVTFTQIFLQIFRMVPVGTAGEKNAAFLSCSPTWDCRSEKCYIFPLQSQLGLQEKNMPFFASAVLCGTIFKTHPKRYCSPNWGCSNADLLYITITKGANAF